MKWFGALALSVLVSPALADPIDVCPAQAAYMETHGAEITALQQAAVSQLANDKSASRCVTYATQLKALDMFRAGLDLCQDHAGEYAAVSARLEATRQKVVGNLQRANCTQAP